MAKLLSPLRYPGGKSKIYERVKTLIESNLFENRTYVEPFAGGFGLGVALLFDNIMQNAVLNDLDTHIYNFWYSVLNYTDELLEMIEITPVTIEEREKQLNIYRDNNNSVSILDDGFATLFLNRVNFSGIIKGGPIGGFDQEGAYKIDCRFNKERIRGRIGDIALLRDRIDLHNRDASDLIINQLDDIRDTAFFNIDPPYVMKGNQLYTNYFEESDHQNLARVINEHLRDIPWIVTYDDCELIWDIYEQYHITEYSIQHNAGGTVRGRELVITNIPEDSFVW